MTLRENRRAFGDYAFVPHRLGGIVRDKIDSSVTMLGEKLPHPIIVSPLGSHGLVHPEAEIATAQGAAKSGGFLCVSSASTMTVEEIGKATAGPKWFQMYLNVDQGISKELLQRVKPAGFKAVILHCRRHRPGLVRRIRPAWSVPALAPLWKLHHRQRKTPSRPICHGKTLNLRRRRVACPLLRRASRDRRTRLRP